MSTELFNDTVMEKQRARMVRMQISRRGIRDKRVLDAMKRVPRHLFIPPVCRDEAYEDHPVPIGYEQTISQPYVVASMTEELGLKENARVLEIGTGSGYQSAVLSLLCSEVYTVETIEELHKSAVRVLGQLDYNNVYTKHGNGLSGWPEKGPFDGIIVTAVSREIPKHLIEQLAVGANMVIPLETPDSSEQELALLKKTSNGIRRESLYPVKFVPLIEGEL